MVAITGQASTDGNTCAVCSIQPGNQVTSIDQGAIRNDEDAFEVGLVQTLKQILTRSKTAAVLLNIGQGTLGTGRGKINGGYAQGIIQNLIAHDFTCC